MSGLELLFPVRCAGCAEPGQQLCQKCRTALAAPPRRVITRIDPHIPVFAMGPYDDAHRGVIIAAKEKNNLRIRPLVAAVLGAGITYLQAAGELTHDITLVPAPTRPRVARRRGGDPVDNYCRYSGFKYANLLSLKAATADQSGLSAADRRTNLTGRVVLRGIPPSGPIVLVDDVVTTGATLAAATERLLVAGSYVQAAVVIASA